MEGRFWIGMRNAIIPSLAIWAVVAWLVFG